MYAVIETGGKQYRVEVGTELEIEKLDAAPGDAVAFDRVLLVADGDAASIGRPVVENAKVSGEIVRRDRGEKLISFKYRPKARRRVKKGHRQELSVVRISDIVVDGKSAAGALAKAEEARKTERQRLEEAARRQAEQDAALAAKLAADKAMTAKSETAKGKTAAKPTAKPAAKPAARVTAKAAPSAKKKPATKASAGTAKADTTGRGARTTAKTTDAGKASEAGKTTRTRKTEKE
jgi:large subunit ribosomal protein L21